MALAPLSAEASDELVGTVVVHPRTTSALAYPLHARTDGNPHMMLEILAHLKSTGALVADGEEFQLVRPLDAESDIAQPVDGDAVDRTGADGQRVGPVVQNVTRIPR